MWETEEFTNKAKKSRQRALLVSLRHLYPREEIVEDFSHPHLHFTASNFPMELDLWMTGTNKAFEYQGRN
jgi:hypothetical protein